MFRNEKLKNQIMQFSAVFFEENASNISLITITNCEIFEKQKKAILYITALPENKEIEALAYVRRRLGELQEFLQKKMRIRSIPFLEAQIDQGEKAQRRIEELLRSS